jgi:hypothetical protein
MDGYVLPREVPDRALRAHITDRTDILAKPRHNINTYAQSLWDNKHK